MKGITITISGEPEYKNKISYKGVDCLYEELENGIKIVPLNFCDNIGMGAGASIFINDKNEIV